MNTSDVIRAWNDPEFRTSLPAKKRENLPEHPAGLSFLTDEELQLVVGGLPPVKCTCSPSAITSVTIHPSCPDCG